MLVSKGLKITKSKISTNATMIVTGIVLSYFFLLLFGDFYHCIIIIFFSIFY